MFAETLGNIPLAKVLMPLMTAQTEICWIHYIKSRWKMLW